MRRRRFLPSKTWFVLALIAVTLLLAACPGGGSGRY
jgi:hypothetical protein